MGTNSRGTRFGQNSSGQRTTRSTTTPSVSSYTNHPDPSKSPLISRPGSAHKKNTAVLRSVGRAAATAKRKPPPASRQPPPQEEILAEIVVSTDELDEVDAEMSEDEGEVLARAGTSDGHRIDVHGAVFETAPQSKELVSQPPPVKLASTEPEAPGPEVETAPAISGTARKQTPLPPSIDSSSNEQAVQKQVPKYDTPDDATQAISFEGRAPVDQLPKDKTSIEPAREVLVPPNKVSVYPVTAMVQAETNEKQTPQLDVQDDTLQILPKGEVTPYSLLQIAMAGDAALARKPSAETELDVPNTDMANVEPLEQQTAPPDVENDAPRVTPATAKPVPIPIAQDVSKRGPILEDFEPADFEPAASRTTMTSPAAQNIIEPQKAAEDPLSDEPLEYNDAMEADWSHDTPAALAPVEKDIKDEKTPDFEPTEDSHEDSLPVIKREPRLTPGVIPSLSPYPSESLPTEDNAFYEMSEEEGALQSQAGQSEPTDINLDDPVPRRDVVLNLEDNPLALKLRRVIDPSVTPSLETSAAPMPADAMQGSLGLMSNEDIEHAFKEAAKAVSKATDTPLTDAMLGEPTSSDGITPTATTAPAVLKRAFGDRLSEAHYFAETTSGALPPSYAAIPHQTPVKSTLKQVIGESRNSFASSSSLSALTDLSGLSSKPPSLSSKATTPFDTGSPRETLGHFPSGPTFQFRSVAPRLQFNVRPKVSIPADLSAQEYAMECIEAGENSRLNPYALHQEEYLMLRSHISHGQVTTYLNIRNGILRLWVRNPQIAVTREEAIGCAKDTRWFDVANVCFDWLVRRGYINYGCVEIRQSKSHDSHIQPRKQKTVVVIGAGFSGLGCARQLEGLSKQYSKRFREMGEEPPRVVVLEGRNRVGGRVYSRAFETLPATAPGVMRGRRFTAEMGGMIITGFERGNPLNILVRGQLGLPYHCLLADMSLHDSNGTNVDLQRDTLVEQLYNACLERVSEYKFKTQPTKLIEGNRDLLDEGRDSSAEGHKTIALIEETTAAQPHAPSVSEQNVAPQVDLVPVSTNRMTGKVHTEPGTPGSTRAACKAKQIGWTLKAGVNDTKDIDLDAAVNESSSTLGSVLDNALMQHKDILDLNAQDFRLFNWHIANLEYSNATNLNRLSSRGWDVDVGNEWDGRHTMVVGGYQSVARGLAMLPAPLDIRHKAAVKRIKYALDGPSGPARITLENGKSIDADYVVNTIPLGVLKHGNVEFQPPLPSWKTQAIERLGFGVLNKVILVYKEAFWDKDRDIFGMLQTPTNRSSLNQKDYAARRGRFFQWFSVTNTTGMPCLLALMAGDAAYDTEITPNDELIAEATEVLRMRYGARVTQPLEAIVTRWESDRFARGSYSNAGVNMQPEDYQLMARTIGNLYFAGEHTIVTHPATVHGAYLSGLRAASDVLDAMLGPIDIPTPLILPRETSASLKRKAQEEHKDPAHARLEAYEMEITEHIHATIGYYPPKPVKVAGNPYILFNKANYEVGRKKCEEGRRTGKGKPSPNEVRTMTSKMWKEASPEVRKPFEDAAEEQKRGFATALREWTEAAVKWEREAMALRERYVKEHPNLPGAEEAGGSNDWNGARRAKRMVESYREADSDIDMD